MTVDVLTLLGMTEPTELDIAMAHYMHCIDAEKFLGVTINALRARADAIYHQVGMEKPLKHVESLIQDREIELDAIRDHKEILQAFIDKESDDG